MFRFGRFTLAAFGLLVSLVSCATPPKQAPEGAASTAAVEKVAWEAIEKGAVIVDVRTDEEFQLGHLPGALHIPYDQMGARAGEIPGGQKQAMVLYCRSGRRSGIAKQTLEGLGYTNTINGGGFEALERAKPQ